MSYRILVVGAGAVGGYFGGRLAAAGRDVTFLVRPSRAEQLRRDGLRIRSPHGNLSLAPQITTAAEIRGPYDAIFLSVKGFGLEGAFNDIASAIGPDSVVFPVLNGMRHMDRLMERFGPGPILGGVCMVAAELDSEGRIIQLGDMQKLLYGELDGTVTPRVQRLHEAIHGAGFEAAISPDIVGAMWDKWMTLASLGAACCLLRGSVGEMVAAPGGEKVVRTIVDECAAVASALGHAPSQAAMQRAISMLTTVGSPLTSSMYRDLLKGGEIEADPIIGDLVRRADQAGVNVPLLRAALVNLSIYSARRSG